MNNCCQNVYPDEDLNRWSVTPSTMIEDADNYYTKHQIDEMLNELRETLQGKLTAGNGISIDSANTISVIIEENNNEI